MAETPEVDIVNKEGKTFTVPQSGLPAALKMGYKLAPPPAPVITPKAMVEVISPQGVRSEVPAQNARAAFELGYKPAVNAPGWLTGMFSQFLNGMVSGFGDEIGGVAVTLPANMMGMDTGTMRQDVTRKAAEANRQFQQQNPVMSTVANIAGGVLPAMATGGLSLSSKLPVLAETVLPEGVKQTAKGAVKEWGKARARIAIDAAPFAGVSGFGSTDGGVKERLEGAGQSMIYGPAIAAGVTGLISPIVGAARYAKNVVSPYASPYLYALKDMVSGRKQAPPLPAGSPADIMPPAPPVVPRPAAAPTPAPAPSPAPTPAPAAPSQVPRVPSPLVSQQGSPRYIAEQKVLEAVRNSDRTLEQVLEDARRAQELGYPDVSLTDLLAPHGNNMMRRAKGAFLKSGPEQNRYSRALTERQEGAGGRIRGAVNEVMNVSEPAHIVAANLEQQAVNRARPHYTAAMEAHPEVTDPGILSLMRLPDFRKAYQVAQRSALKDPDNPTVLPDIFNEKGELQHAPSLANLDIVKKVVWNMISNMKKSRENAPLHADIEPMERGYARFVERLRGLSPDYSRALDEYRGPKQLKDALDAGINFFSGKPHEIEELVHGLATQAEREHFQLGVAEAIRFQLGKGGLTEDVHKLLAKGTNRQELLRAAFPSEESFRGFLNRLDIEHNQTRVHQWMHGGSPTVENQEAVAALGDGLPGALWKSLSSVSPKPIAAYGVDQLQRAIPAAVAEEINPLTLGPIWRSLPRLQEAEKQAQRARQIQAARRGSTQAAKSNLMGNIAGLLTGK